MKQMKSRFGYGLLAVFLILPFLATPAAAWEAKVSGQVNQLFMWADDGDRSDVFIADNNNSSTRFRFAASEDFGKVKAGVLLEFDAFKNRTFELTLDQNDDGVFRFRDRWLNIYFDTTFGKFEIGQGSGAADTTSESDLSGTGVINYSGVADTAGGFGFQRNGVATGITVGDVRSNFDGLGRNMRIRYNTPSFGGLRLATSMTNGEAYEFGAFYAAEFAGNKLAASVGFVDTNQRDDADPRVKQWSGSVSWLMPFGLNLTGAYGEQDILVANRLKAYHYYFKLGYKFDIHAFSVEYGWNENLQADNEDSSNWGVAYVISPWSGVEFYASYRLYMLQVASGPDPDDIKQAMVGTRIKF